VGARVGGSGTAGRRIVLAMPALTSGRSHTVANMVCSAGLSRKVMNAARSLRMLSTVAPIIFGLIVVLALLSIIGRWPHQFGGQGDPDHIIQELLTSGTATAPPLPILIAFGVVAAALPAVLAVTSLTYRPAPGRVEGVHAGSR
jgi:hypothetical protein